MKICFFSSLVKCLQIFVLLIGFFYSSFSFSAVLISQLNNAYGSYNVYDVPVSCFVSYSVTSTSAYIIYSSSSGLYGCSTSSIVLSAMSKYRDGDALVVSCPVGKLPDSNRICQIAYQCWDGSQAVDQAHCPADTRVTCWDGSQVVPPTACPPDLRRTCSDGSKSSPLQQCSEDCGLNTPVWDSTQRICKRGDCPIGEHQDLTSPIFSCVVDVSLCPDGVTYESNPANCPQLHTCWNGNRQYTLCPPEPNCAYNERVSPSGCAYFSCPADSIYITVRYGSSHEHICDRCGIGTHPSFNQSSCLPNGSDTHLLPTCSNPQTHYGCTPPPVNILPNGDKVRTYPDGTVTTTHPDGTIDVTPPSGGSPFGGSPSPNGGSPLPSPTGGGSPSPSGDNPAPAPGQPGGFNGQGTTEGFEGGLTDGRLFVSQSLCYDRLNCARSYCDTRPLDSSGLSLDSSCSGYSGFSFKNLSDFGVLQAVSAECPTFDFNLSVFHNFSTFHLDSHCVFLRQIKPYMAFINNVEAFLVFILIVLSA